jgi:hypothetical protein
MTKTSSVILLSFLLGAAICVDYNGTVCTTTNYATACASFISANPWDTCCATINVKNGSAANVTANYCYIRSLAVANPVVTANNLTITYTCLTAANTTGAPNMTNCTTGDQCGSTQCCQGRNVTQLGGTKVLTTGRTCVDTTAGLAGVSYDFKYTTTPFSAVAQSVNT